MIFKKIREYIEKKKEEKRELDACFKWTPLAERNYHAGYEQGFKDGYEQGWKSNYLRRT